MKGSEDGRYCIKSLRVTDFSKHANFGGIIENIEVLGTDEVPSWKQTEEGLILNMSAGDEKPVVFKIVIK